MRAFGLRIEDLLLAAWNAAGVPLVATAGLSPIITLGRRARPCRRHHPARRRIGAIVAVATRPTGSVPVAEPLGTDGRLRSTARWCWR